MKNLQRREAAERSFVALFFHANFKSFPVGLIISASVSKATEIIYTLRLKATDIKYT